MDVQCLCFKALEAVCDICHCGSNDTKNKGCLKKKTTHKELRRRFASDTVVIFHILQ
jgi:hypothetical protein